MDHSQEVEFVADYLMTWIRIWQPNWKSGTWQGGIPQQGNTPNLFLLANFRVKKLSAFVQEVLLNWYKEKFQLRLFVRPLQAEEILDLQCSGARCISCVLPPFAMTKYVLGERDPFSFCVHDLVHAHHFFANPESLSAQIGFARWVKRSLQEGVFESLMHDQQFTKDFEYVYADMNAHPFHLLKYLRAKLDLQRGVIDPDQVWSNFYQSAQIKVDYQVFNKVNRPEETTDDAIQLSNWLSELAK